MVQEDPYRRLHLVGEDLIIVLLLLYKNMNYVILVLESLVGSSFKSKYMKEKLKRDK